jgi:hypothetical protein
MPSLHLYPNTNHTNLAPRHLATRVQTVHERKQRAHDGVVDLVLQWRNKSGGRFFVKEQVLGLGWYVDGGEERRPSRVVNVRRQWFRVLGRFCCCAG